MSLRINTNVSALRTHSNLVGITTQLEGSIQRLSSGMRINKAADDAAGLTISEKLRRQVRGLGRATMNAQDGISMIQSAEGALNETHSILHRMRELAIQASNDTLTSNDRLEIQKEIMQLRDDIDRIASDTEFNTKRLLNGSQSASASSNSSYVRGLVTGDVRQGGGYQVSLALLQAGVSQRQTTSMFTIKDSANELADGGTMLVSIAQMYDANGSFVLDTPLNLTLSGNAKSAEIYLDGSVTLDELAARIQKAMVDHESGIGMDNSYSRFVSEDHTAASGDHGYLEIVSGSVGTDGMFNLAGDQRVIDALGINVVRPAVDSTIQATLTDENNKTRTTQLSSNRVSGLLDGMDIAFDSRPAQIAGTAGLVDGLRFSSAESFMIEAGGQTKAILIRKGDWTMEGLTRTINEQLQTSATDSLPPIQGLEAKLNNGQIRFEYSPPADQPAPRDSRIQISYAKPDGVLGLQNGTYTGFLSTRKREDKHISGFSNYMPDVEHSLTTVIEISDGHAKTRVNLGEIPSLTASDSLLYPDMIEFDDLQQKINQALEGAEVAVRVDRVDNVMVFTSTHIGKYNVGEHTSRPGLVSIKAVSAKETAEGVQKSFVPTTSALLKQMGIDQTERSGVGDTNFRMHVKNYDNQYQIGANQRESMRVSMAEMSSEALGVNNLDVTTIEGAQRAIGRLNRAIDKVSAERSRLGAYQNRLEFTIENLRSMRSNATASESRIRDADFAYEMVNFTRNQVMSQSANAMVAQANAQSSSILELLR